VCRAEHNMQQWLGKCGQCWMFRSTIHNNQPVPKLSTTE
jgi:hypothetical protein